MEKKNKKCNVSEMTDNTLFERSSKELGEKIRILCEIYHPNITIMALGSLLINYVVQADIDKDIFLQGISDGMEYIKNQRKAKK